MVTRFIFDALGNYSQTSDGIGTHQAAKLRGAAIEVDRRAAVASDDGHLRATVVTDTHLLDFIFYCQTKNSAWLKEGGEKKKTPLYLLRLNSKSGCDSEGIHSLHPLSDWCWDYYVLWKRLKVTKLGFISRSVLSVSSCQGGFSSCKNVDRVLLSFRPLFRC